MSGPRRSGAGLAASLLLLAACGGAGAGPATDRALDEPAAPSTTATTAPVERTVPDPVDGTLRTRIDAALLPEQRPVDDHAPDDVLLFGDSVSVLVADEVAAGISSNLHVDGIDCRRLDLAFVGPCGGVPAGRAVPTGVEGLADAMDELADEGISPGAVVVVMANNAALRQDDVDAAMDLLADVPMVWWVTTNVSGRGWRDPNNELLADLAEGSDQVGLIDWYAYSLGEDWVSDLVHPNDEGQVALGGLIAATLRCGCRA